MRPETPDREDSLALSVDERIDEVCTRFEAAWQAGQGPRIEAFLGGVDGAECEALLRQLLRIELEYRCQGGSVPAVEEYLGRFPGYEALIREEIERRAAQAVGVPRPPPEVGTGVEGSAGRTGPYAGGPDSEPVGAGYEVRGRLDEGGMAEVWLAHDLDLDRPIALKVMRAELCNRPGAEGRFMDEARITGRLQHPGIPPVHEVGRLDDGRPFLAMKLIEGRRLHELLNERPSPASELSRFVAFFGQICQAVGYAHSRGVIHRDLKPHNVMVGAFGEVQVMDWGLAKEHGARGTEDGTEPSSTGAPGATAAGTILGTPSYMSPEAARGEVDRVDERADVFGLGAVLCVILTGQPAFIGTDSVAVVREAASGRWRTASLGWKLAERMPN